MSEGQGPGGMQVSNSGTACSVLLSLGARGDFSTTET